MPAAEQYVDPVNGIDGTGTLGVDWVGNPGSDPSTPRKTADVAAGLQAGMRIYFKRGTTYKPMGKYTRINGTVVSSTTDCILCQIGTASTLKKDRVYLGAYGEGPRPIIDAGGMDTAITACQGLTIQDLDITNYRSIGIGVGSGAANVEIRRNIIRGAIANNNDSEAVYINGANCLVELNILTDNAADNVFIDALGASSCTVRRNFVLRIGAKSLDGADGFVATHIPESLVIQDNVFEKVSRQKQIAFWQRVEPEANPTTTPVFEKNCCLGHIAGAGALSIISGSGSTVRYNFFGTSKGIGSDRRDGASRYAEGIDAYCNVLVGIPTITMPDGSPNGSTIDPAGPGDLEAFITTANASTPVLNKFRNNFVYNFRACIGGPLDTTKTVAHNNIIVRCGWGALSLPAAVNAAANGNLLYDDQSPGAVLAGSPVANIYHDSTASGKPARIPGAFPAISGDFGLLKSSMGYFQGDGTSVPSTDYLGNSFTTDNTGADGTIGPVQY